MSGHGWRRYVETMCRDAWDLDPRALESVIQGIEALIAEDRVTDSAVAEVLCRDGVSEFAADMVAPSIRVTIARTDPSTPSTEDLDERRGRGTVH